jgi:hypothetical protein
MAKTIFSGPHNINRAFVNKDTGVAAKINIDRGYNPQTGDRIIEKDVSSIDRINVTIAPSKENDFLRQSKREADAMILQSMAPDPSNMGVRAVYEDDLVLNSDFTDMGQKERAEKAVKQRAELIDLQMQAAINQAKQALAMSQAPVQGGATKPMINPEQLPSQQPMQSERPEIPPVK